MYAAATLRRAITVGGVYDHYIFGVCTQLEVEFGTIAELEQFWANIPPQDHKAWSQRAQVWTML